MRYVQLRAFHYVATCGGFSRAAEALCLTQPAISDQVRKLEEEYDILLFNRVKKQVEMTKAGLRLLEVTNRLFENERQALELLSESRAFSSGTLRIIADSAHHVMPVLSSFRSKYPGIFISMRTGNTEEVVNALYRYDADIGVLGEVPHNKDINVLKLSSTPIVAFASKDSPYSGLRSLTLEDLSGHSLVLREVGSKTRAKLEEAAQACGIDLKADIEVEGREAVREIVASGAGIGVVATTEFGNDNRLVQIPIAGPAMLMDEALICLRERNGGKLIRAFMTMAEHQAKMADGAVASELKGTETTP